MLSCNARAYVLYLIVCIDRPNSATQQSSANIFTPTSTTTRSWVVSLGLPTESEAEFSIRLLMLKQPTGSDEVPPLRFKLGRKAPINAPTSILLDIWNEKLSSMQIGNQVLHASSENILSQFVKLVDLVSLARARYGEHLRTMSCPVFRLSVEVGAT